MNVKRGESIWESIKKQERKSDSQRVPVIVIYTSVVLLKAIVSSEMAFKLWKIMGSGKARYQGV